MHVCTHILILSIFLQSFEHESISLFWSHALIMVDVCKAAPFASVLVTEQVRKLTNPCKHFPHIKEQMRQINANLIFEDHTALPLISEQRRYSSVKFC